MTSLREIEQRLNLSEWQRNLGNKRTKAGKYFWLFVLINYEQKMKGKMPFDMQMVCEEYNNIFYRPYEGIVYLLECYEGERTVEMRKKLNVEDSKEFFIKNIKMNIMKLEDRLRKWLKTHDVSFGKIAPELAEFYDLDFLDNRQPHLSIISDSYKRLLNAANHQFVENRLLIQKEWMLTPSTVKKTFNTVMDEISRYRCLFHIIGHLRDYLNTSFDIFHTKTRIAGPTDAVREMFTLTPEIADYTNKQLKYHLKLKYADLDGNDFSDDSIRKAIQRNRDEHS